MSLTLTGAGGPGGFSPASLNPALWLDASDAATLFQNSNGTTAATADGDPVGYWGDKSGNGRNVTQATGTKRPVLKLAIQNGRNVIRFDGVNDFLQAAFASISQPFTYFMVLSQTSGQYIFDDAVANTCNLQYVSPNLRAVAGVACVYAETQPIAMSQFTFLYAGASSLIRRNGVQKVASTAGTNGQSGITIGQAFNGTAGSAMDVCELILLPANATANFTTVEAYLKNKWGTP